MPDDTAPSYAVEFGWDCPSCGNCNGTGDVDAAGTEQTCEQCGTIIQVTT